VRFVGGADGDSAADDRIAALYELPLEEFTSARNQAAQQLRKAGERELSEQVKGLRKPSVAAWTLNQLRHRQPELVAGLLDAGLQLRQAQERLLDRGERGLLRDAAAQERRLVQETVAAAEAMLREAGQAVSPALHNKLWETAHAAALDPDLGETLRRGRLLEDRQLSDLGLIGGLGSGPGSDAATAPKSAEPAAAETIPKNQRRLEQARERKQKLEEKLQSTQQAADEAEGQLRQAQTALRNAEAEAARALTRAERARAAAERAHAATEHARGQVQAAADRVDALEADG
jgi:hypothetical protein